MCQPWLIDANRDKAFSNSIYLIDETNQLIIIRDLRSKMNPSETMYKEMFVDFCFEWNDVAVNAFVYLASISSIRSAFDLRMYR